jgi:hypothetical protein
MQDYKTKEINKIFENFLELQTEDKQEKIKWLINQFKNHLPYLKELRQDCWKKEGDYRNGFETYGYNNVAEIYSNIEYISDRYNCAFRLNWLIGLIDPSDEQHSDQWENHTYLF